MNKMFKCPECGFEFNESLIGICPDCKYENKAIFKWMNPNYRLSKDPNFHRMKRRNNK